MENDYIKVIERSVMVAVDPASGEDKCCRVKYVNNSDGSMTILSVEEWQPSVLRFDNRR